MKLRLPRQLMAAVVAAVSAVTFGTLATGTAAYGSTTYDDLTTKDYFVANENVYNTGTGKYYLETEGCTLNLTLTMNLKAFEAYQGVHDYANAGNYSSFVSWTYAGNAGSTYGLADISSNHSSVNYSGITGMWNGSPWSQTTDGRYITLDTLRSYADESGNVTLTINNNPGASSNHVTVTAQNAQGTQTLYAGDGLRSQNYTSQHITSFTVNTNYVTSVTLNTESTLNSSSFTPPKDYTIPFESERTDDTSVGRVLFMGDSITHGVEDMSYRWGLFKTFVDNGIENEIVGPLTGYNSTPLNTDYNGDTASTPYGGQVFENVHYAQASGRTHNMLTASSSQNSLEGKSTGVNYGGVSSAKVGKEYNADTYIMMMGTNDILSDGANTAAKMATVTERLLGAGEVQNGAWVNADKLSALVGIAGTDPETAAHKGKWGTMGQIIDNVKMQEGDTMYVLSIPTWAQGRQNIQVYANYVPGYNENLKLWTEAYSASHTGTVKYVDINRGLIDKTLGGSFLGPNDFFRQVGGDYLHPNEQGALIIAGNLAQGMGLAGRTAGLHRADSQTAGTTWLSGEAEYTINAGQSVNLATNAFNVMGGYTVDFSANFGNGATDGWLDKTNALSISVGDGSNVGTLKLSEGYISWGDTKLLFCQDNSVQGNDNIRIAYHTGDADHQVGQGYYVWLGDMLIGQALTAGSGSLNGITLSSTGATGTVSGLTYSNTAYAPTTTGITSAENAFYATITKVLESHDNAKAAVSSGINWTGATDKSVAKAAVVTAASAFTDGKATINVTGTGTNFFAAANVTAEGSVEARVDGQTASSAFAVLGGTLTGDVTMEFSNSSVANGSFSGTSAALSGSYNGASITGTFAAYIDNTSFAGDIVGGALTGAGSIAGVNLVLNSGAVNGTVYGGSKSNGTVGTGEGNAVSIAVNGGHITGNVNGGGTAGTVNGNAEITINGGIIDGNITGGDIQGQSTVTVVGNKASIGGNITADTVKLKNVEATEYADAFDKYKGTITATNLVLDGYTAGKVNATLVTDYVTATNGTIATIHGLTLRNCSIDATGATALTLGETIHSGNTISYSGNIRLEDGTSFTIDNPTAVTEGAEGFSDGFYIYKVTDGQTGSLQAADGTALTGTHTATFTGTGDLDGKLFSYESSTGALIAHSNTATYNIESSTVDYSGISSAAGVTMSGGQLNLDTTLTSGTTITATGGTVNIGEGVTLVSSSVTGTVKVTGEGALSIGNKKVLPTGISLDETGWTGTVVLSGEVEGGHSFQNLSTANSSVTLQGVRSWIQKSGNVTAHLVLDGDDNGSASGAALSITGANNTGNGGTYTFSGQLSGSGDIAYIQEDGRNSVFVISGDASDWSGSFVNYNNGTPQVKLTPTATSSVIGGGVEQRGTGTLAVTIGANAATVNGAIQQINGTLNLTLEGAATTFNNEVTVNNLSASGKTVRLGAAGDVVPGGNLTVGGSAVMGKLIADEGTTVTFNGTSVQLSADNSYQTSNVEASKAAISLADGTNVRVSGDVNIGTLHVGGNVAVADNRNVNYIRSATIHNLSSEAGAHLTLAAVFDTSLNTTYTLGGANTVASANDFNGTIEFKRNNSKTGYATQLILADTNIAKDAVIELNNANAGSKFGIGIAASTVKVAGIQDAEGTKGALIFSGSDYNNPDSTVRTLEITGSGTYATSATVGANLNILVSGTGTQTFTGDMSAFNGTFTTQNAGLVQLATGAADMGVITMHNSSAAQAATLQFSAKEGATNEYTFSTWTMSGDGDNGLKWMVVDEGVTVKGTGSNIGVGSVATINNGWGIAGGGLEVNGKLITAGTISMDGPSSSTLKGKGIIQTAGLNVSNGNTVNVEGGVRIEVTSDKGIYKRDGGASTLNLADATLSATTTDWELKSSINNVNLTSADKGTTFDAAAERTITVSKTMGGSGALMKTGEGKLTLNTANTFSGGVTIKDGTLEMKNASALGSGALAMEGGTLEVAQGVKASVSAAADKDLSGSITVALNGELNVLQFSTEAKAELQNLTLASNAVLGIYTGQLVGIEKDEASVTVVGTMTTAAGAALNANLTLAEGATLTSNGALTMGSTVTLGGDLILNVAGDADSAPVCLFTDVEGLTLGANEITKMGWYDANGILTSVNGTAVTGEGQYVIGYWNGTVSVAEASVPEPATATLSLLALAALAARRKRK